MLQINPVQIEEIADDISRINNECFKLCEEMSECIFQLRKMKGINEEITVLDQIYRELVKEVENHKDYSSTLINLTECYIASDNRAIERSEGTPSKTEAPAVVTLITVPSNKSNIIF